MQDDRIIQLYWERSQDAIRETDQKYGKYCHTIAWNILYSKEDSEECVNDTWLKAWDAIPPSRPQLLKAFLGTITRNLALNRYEKAHAKRRGQCETTVCLDELSECVAGDHPQDQLLDRMVITECLNRFLDSLKPEERKLFVRRYWYMSTVKEIAEMYGISESKVKMSLLRTRGKLRETLVKEGIPI